MAKKTLFYFLITFSLFIVSLSSALAAEKYPSREIQLYVAVRPGGTTGIIAQFLKDSLEKNLGVPIIINYRSGGGGAVGPNILAKAKPDGYTLGNIDSAKMVLLPAKMPAKIPYRTTDFDPLAKSHISPGILVCKADAPWKTLEDLVADAKKRPGQIAFGATTNSISHNIMKGILKHAGIDMLHIPTKGAGQTITRVLGGNIAAGMVAAAPVVGQIKAGALRGLFLTERVSPIPNTPTLKELGYPPPDFTLYFGFYAPVGLPKHVREVLVNAIQKTLQDPLLKKKMDDIAVFLDYLPSEDFTKAVREDYARLVKLYKTTGK
ncbi:Bug family tripartite tricarboxylate transporter substrate binding protein [Thermodesulfobacteriota bacterium]